MEPLLLLTSRRGNTIPVTTPSGWEVEGEVEWLLQGPAELIAAAHRALPGVSDFITPRMLSVFFGNAVGLVDIPHLGRISVVSGKWGASHYQQMLADLTAIACALPYSSSSATALPYARSTEAHNDVLYHMFVYLRHILSEQSPPEQQLLPALRQILHDPHQRFVSRRSSVPLVAAQRVDATSIRQIAAGVGGLVRAPEDARQLAHLAGVLRGHLPQHIDELRVEHHVDTPENRFVKLALETSLALIDQMREAIAGSQRSAFSEKLAQDCARMAIALRPIAQHGLWAQVGDLRQIPTSSTVLQGRRGYREVYQHYIRMRLAAQVPLSPTQVRDLLESKDIALLYEIWCYFSLVRAVSSLLGQPSSASRPASGAMEVKIPWDMEVRWPQGVRLLYNARFSRSRSLSRRSYSVPLRPDITLEIHTSTRHELHLFDAKFKVEHLDSLIPSEADEQATDGESAEERRGIFKRGDVYKMHAYRDAIPMARSVWILYPGTETRFFAAVEDEESSLVDGVGRLRTPCEGVGAVALTPADEQPATLRALLRHLLQPHSSV